MNNSSAVWLHALPEGLRAQIRAALGSAAENPGSLQVFFRADDIALVDPQFARMMDLFLDHRAPLCLAVVPAWLDRSAWQKMKEFKPESPSWCWHQHGWNHANHETRGKKCEFGQSRDGKTVRADLLNGRQRLAMLLGDFVLPIFTPPWNRCSHETLQILAELEFSALSRWMGAKPSAAGILSEFAVNVDLHTRREQEAGAGWQNLFQEMEQAARTGRIGFMLHHQRMNEAAFAFLDILLDELRSLPAVTLVTFRELLAEKRF